MKSELIPPFAFILPSINENTADTISSTRSRLASGRSKAKYIMEPALVSSATNDMDVMSPCDIRNCLRDFSPLYTNIDSKIPKGCFPASAAIVDTARKGNAIQRTG